MEISTEKEICACKQNKQEKTVFPRNLRLRLIIKEAIDNFDHNSSSTTATDSFHGTGISLSKHLTENIQGIVRHDLYPLEEPASKKVSELPDSYTSVLPMMHKRKERLTVPKINVSLTRDSQLVEQPLLKETGYICPCRVYQIYISLYITCFRVYWSLAKGFRFLQYFRSLIKGYRFGAAF